MHNLAMKRERRREVRQELGTVVRAEGTTLFVETDTAELRAIRAKRATSCLLEPLPGDLVLVAAIDRDEAYVLAVLEREACTKSSIVTDGDLDIRAAGGTLAFVAGRAVEVVSGGEVSIVSGAVRVHATDGDVVLQRLSVASEFVRAQLGKAKVLAEAFDSVLDRFSQKVKRSYRVVEECDHVRAEQIDYAAKTTLSLHGENALVTAEELVKMEGDQIHLG